MNHRFIMYLIKCEDYLSVFKISPNPEPYMAQGERGGTFLL